MLIATNYVTQTASALATAFHGTTNCMKIHFLKKKNIPHLALIQ